MDSDPVVFHVVFHGQPPAWLLVTLVVSAVTNVLALLCVVISAAALLSHKLHKL